MLLESVQQVESPEALEIDFFGHRKRKFFGVLFPQNLASSVMLEIGLHSVLIWLKNDYYWCCVMQNFQGIWPCWLAKTKF